MNLSKVRNFMFAVATTSLVAVAPTYANTPGTVVDIAVGSQDHTTLVAAVTAAGLVETLSGDGKFTVFAPTNDAFAKLPEPRLRGLRRLSVDPCPGAGLPADIVAKAHHAAEQGFGAAGLRALGDGRTV